MTVTKAEFDAATQARLQRLEKYASEGVGAAKEVFGRQQLLMKSLEKNFPEVPKAHTLLTVSLVYSVLWAVAHELSVMDLGGDPHLD
jgi:hypothetical protein